MPRTRISPRTRGFARRLRREPTDAEQRLWLHLRAMRAQGFHWRRQAPVGPFIADFACFSARLIVELDGGQHAGSTRDARRDAWLKAEGYRVLRVWNSDVLPDPAACLDTIWHALNQPIPTPTPIPTP